MGYTHPTYMGMVKKPADYVSVAHGHTGRIAGVTKGPKKASPKSPVLGK